MNRADFDAIEVEANKLDNQPLTGGEANILGLRSGGEVKEGLTISGKKVLSTLATRVPAIVMGFTEKALLGDRDFLNQETPEELAEYRLANPTSAFAQKLDDMTTIPLAGKIRQHIDEVIAGDTDRGTVTKEWTDNVNSMLGLTPENDQFIAQLAQADPLAATSIPEFIDESLRLVTSQGEIYMNLALPGGLGFAAIWNLMREETSASLKDRIESQGGTYDPVEHRALLDTAATVRGVGEFAVGKAITLAGATGRSGLRSVVNKMISSQKNTKTGAILTTAFTKVLEALSEGEEERFSSFADSYFVNLGLDKAGALDGNEYEKIGWDEAVEMGSEAGKQGRTIGMIMQGAGTPKAMHTAIKKQKAIMKANPMATPEVDSLNPIDKFALEFNIVDNVSKINEEAVLKTKEELYNRIKSLPDADFLKLAQDMGIEAGMDKDQAAAMMADKPFMLVGQTELLTQNRDNIIDNSQIGAFDKFMFKTISNNRITRGDILGVRSMFEGMARDLGFDDVNGFWEAKGGEFDDADIVFGKVKDRSKEGLSSEYKLPAYLAKKLGFDGNFVNASRNRALQMDKLRDLGWENKGRKAVGNLLIFDIGKPVNAPYTTMYSDILEGVKTLSDSDRLDDIQFDNKEVNTLINDIADGTITKPEEVKAAHEAIYANSKIMENINKKNPYKSELARNLWNVSKLRVGLSIVEHGSTARSDGSNKISNPNASWKANESPYHYGNYEGWGLGNAYTWDYSKKHPEMEVAQHEGGHGSFNLVKQQLEEKIRTLPQDQQASIQKIASQLYGSHITHNNNRALNEMWAMYTSGAYNDKSVTVAEGDAMVEKEIALIEPELVGVFRDLRAAERIQKEEAPSGRQIYYQTGANGTLRGSMEWKEGKFVVNLFQDADINTMAHEFAHVFSPYMTDDLVEILAKDIANKRMLTTSSKERAGRVEGYKAVWNMFVTDPSSSLLQIPKNQQLLQEMQEGLANGFETYLGNDRAPNQHFEDIFKKTKRAYLKYYKTLKSSGDMKIDPKMADIFDRMIAGELVLQRDVSREINVLDENGDGYKVTLHETTKQNKAHRKLQTYLQMWEAGKPGGLQEQVTSYVDMMFDRVTPKWKERILRVGSVKDAYKVMKEVDKVLYDQEKVIRKKRIDNIKYLATKLRMKESDVKVQKLADDIAGKLNLRAKKGKQLDELMLLSNELEQALKAGKVPKMLYDITPRQLRDLRNLNRRDINDLTTTELLTVEHSLKILDDLSVVKAEAHVNQKRVKENDEVRAGKGELDNHWLNNDNNELDRKSRHIENPNAAGRIAENYIAWTSKAIDTLEILANGNPNSMYGKIHSALVAGDKRRASVIKMSDKYLGAIFKDLNISEISDVYGTLKDKDKVSAVMEVVTIDKDTQEVVDPDTGDSKTETTLKTEKQSVVKKFTPAQIMYFYGQWMNEDGRKALKNGAVFRGDTRGKFIMSNEGWVSLFDTLTDQQKQKTLDVMDFYAKQMAPVINRESMISVGRAIAQVQNYLPMFRHHNNKKELEVLNLSQLDKNVGTFTNRLLAHMDFTHTRSNSTAPLYVTDIFEGVTLNVSQVATYAGLVNPIDDMKAKIGGSKTIEDNGIYRKSKSVVGRARMDQLEKWIRAIESPPIADSDEKLLVGMARLSQKGLLGLSASIASLQTLSAPLGMKMAGVPDKYIGAVIGKGVVDPSNIGSGAAYSMEQMGEDSDLMYERFRSNLQMSLTEPGMRSAARQKFGQTVGLKGVTSFRGLRSLIAETNGKETFMINHMDAWAISKIREAVEMWGDAEGWSHEQKIKKWEDIVTETQPMSNRIYQSNYLATANPTMRIIFGMFSLPLDQYRGQMRKSAFELKRAALDPAFEAQTTDNTIGGQRKKKAQTLLNRGKHGIKAMNNMVTSVLATAFTAAIVQETWRYIRDDDEDKELFTEERLKSLAAKTAGNMMVVADPIFGQLAAGAINSAVNGWKMTTFGYLPVSVLDRSMDEVNKATAAFEAGEIEEGVKHAINATGRLSVLSGTGISTAARDAKAVIDLTDTSPKYSN